MDYINYVKQSPVQGLTGLYGGVQGSLMAAAAGGAPYDGPTFFGARGIGGGGYPNTADIMYINIASTSNSSDFGDMIASSRARAGASNGTRGLFMGGRSQSPGPDTACEYITITTTGNGTDFGDLIGPINGGYSSGASNETYAFAIGGNCCGDGTDNIQYFTIASAGNGTSFGSLAGSEFGGGSTNNATRCVNAGARGYNEPAYSKIQYFTMGTSGSASNGGDLTVARGYCAAAMSIPMGRGIWMGGMNPSTPNINTMDYVDISTTDNATDFGDLNTACNSISNGGTHNGDGRGIVFGGEVGGWINEIQYVNINSVSNASDFGDMNSTKAHVTGTSGDAS